MVMTELDIQLRRLSRAQRLIDEITRREVFLSKLLNRGKTSGTAFGTHVNTRDYCIDQLVAIVAEMRQTTPKATALLEGQPSGG